MVRENIINKNYKNYSHIVYMWEQKMISKQEYKILKDNFNKLNN